MKHSEQINEIATALALAQSQMTVIGKDGTNPAFKSKYATLANVIEAIRPHLSANGIAFSQGLERSADQYVMTTMLLHKSGQWLSYEFPLNIPELKASTIGHLMQAFGSLTTYACRYGLTSACGCAPGEEDDDAETAKQLPVPRKEPSKEADEFLKCKEELLSVLQASDLNPRLLLEFCRGKALVSKTSGVDVMKECLYDVTKFVAEYRDYLKTK